MGKEFNQAPEGVKTCLESIAGKDEFEKSKTANRQKTHQREIK